LAGAAVGLLLSTWATNALLASLRPVLPVALTLPELDLDWRVLVGTIGFSLLVSLVFTRKNLGDHSNAGVAQLAKRTRPRTVEPP